MQYIAEVLFYYKMMPWKSITRRYTDPLEVSGSRLCAPDSIVHRSARFVAADEWLYGSRWKQMAADKGLYGNRRKVYGQQAASIPFAKIPYSNRLGIIPRKGGRK